MYIFSIERIFTSIYLSVSFKNNEGIKIYFTNVINFLTKNMDYILLVY